MKDIPTSPRITQIKRNRKVGQIRLVLLFIILFVCIIGALSYFSSYSKLIISNVVITGNNIIDSKELEKKVDENITGRYVGLFDKTNFLIYPKSKIYNTLIIDFPRIETLSIKRDGLNTIHISITERAGSFLYCGIGLPEKTEDIGENCYFVNNDGLVFDKAPYFSGDIYFKYYTEMKIVDGKILGSNIFEENHFHEIVRFVDGVISLGFKPIYMVKGSDNIYSLYLKSTNDKLNPKIIFKEDNDLVMILDNLKTAMVEKEFANEINSKYDTLSYVDLRFKNKVLYKFQ